MTTSSLATLPRGLQMAVLAHLDAVDLERLGQTSRQFCSLSRDELLWKGLTQDVFGITLDLQQRLAEAGVEFAEPHRRAAEPENWRAYYKQRTLTLRNLDGDRVEEMYAQVQTTLEALQEATRDELGLVASILLDILDVMPFHVPSFYSLAFVCFLLNAFDTCEHIISAGLTLDAAFQPLLDLSKQVERAVEKLEGNEDDAPLLDSQGRPSPELRAALHEVFDRFDTDRNGSLSHRELIELIRTLNGSVPTPTTLRNLTRNYQSTASGELLFEGFLEFYRRQTLDDPEETRSDLAKLGFNRALELHSVVKAAATA